MFKLVTMSTITLFIILK